MLAQTAPILAELSAVERVLARERTAHAETRDALQHANLRAREARAALAAEASTGVLQLVRKAVVDATKGSSSAQQRLDQLYLILPPREGSQPQASACRRRDAAAKRDAAAYERLEEKVAAERERWQVRLDEAEARSRQLAIQLAQARTELRLAEHSASEWRERATTAAEKVRDQLEGRGRAEEAMAERVASLEKATDQARPQQLACP
eukprot:scaffold50813_cov78-Phaeocystis_antarctica.AAC.1